MDFASIPDASFARHRLTNPKEQVYSTLLGNAHVNFIVRCASALILALGSGVYVTLNKGGKVRAKTHTDTRSITRLAESHPRYSMI